MSGWWQCGLGSDQRFTPKWWQRRAYIEGLRDAARIVEHRTWAPDRPQVTREALKDIHARVLKIQNGR